ncbi:MAG: ABC transporter permease [Candidatus Riflebacteria bacterium]|nr:ABC transporter permease [Candidatus Riflebacteria bacterium]
MIIYSIRRVAGLVPILLGVLLVTFLLMQAIPGNPIDRLVGQAATADERARLRHNLGLDRPLAVQFGIYLSNLARGDLGQSFASREDVGREMLSRLPNTVRLGVYAMVIASLLGVLGGVVSAVWAGGAPDHLVRVLSVFGLSTPIFWFGLLLMLLFARCLEWLPPSGDGQSTFSLILLPGLGFKNGWPHLDFSGFAYLVLPALTLGVRPAAFISRVMRSQMLEVLSSDFIRTARAKGLSEWAVVFRHALANAMIPVVTLIGVDLGSLLAGSVITETVFSYRGLGMYTLEGIKNREYPIVLGTVLLTSVMFVLANLAVDLACAWLDPRLRVEGRS